MKINSDIKLNKELSLDKKLEIKKKDDIENQPTKFDMPKETADTSVTLAPNLDIDDFVDNPEPDAETQIVRSETSTKNTETANIVSQNSQVAPTQEEIDEFLAKNNPQSELVTTPVQYETNNADKSDINDVLSNEEKTKIYNDITNSVKDPAAREQALQNTGIDFSFLTKKEGLNVNGDPVANWINNAVKDAAEWVNTAAGDTENWLKNAASNVGEWIKNVANAPGEWLQNAVNDTGDWIQNAVDNVEEWLKNAANNTGEWIENAANDVGNWLKNAAGNVGDFFKNIFSGKKEPDEKISVENQTVEAANIPETNIADNYIKVKDFEEFNNAVPENINENAEENFASVNIETIQDNIKNKLGDVIFEKDDVVEKYRITSSDGQALGYFDIDEDGTCKAFIVSQENDYVRNSYNIDTEGNLVKTGSTGYAYEFFQDFANEYDKETGKFKEDGHFPNGMQDVINYLNSSPELAELVIGAIALDSKVKISEISPYLVDKLQDINLLDSKNSINSIVSDLTQYISGSLTGNKDNIDPIALQLDGVVANLLDETGNSDLLRSLYQNQNLNIGTLAYLVGAADTREEISTNNKNTQSIDGELFDLKTKQGQTGDCWLLSSLISSVDNEQMKELIENLVTIDEQNKIYTVTINGENYSYTFEELGMAKDLSRGDADVRAFEMAIRDVESNRGENFNGGSLYNFVVDLAGGNPDNLDISSKDVLRGKVENSFEQAMQEIKDGGYLVTCGYPYKNNDITVYDENGNKVIAAKDNDGTEHSFVGGHEYAVLGADDEYVYIKNPWNSDEKLKITIDDFKKLGYRSISVNKFKELIETSNKNAELHKEQMSYYNELLESYGDKEITKEDMDKIIAALAEKGIDYYKDIAKSDNYKATDDRSTNTQSAPNNSSNFEANSENRKINVEKQTFTTNYGERTIEKEFDENGTINSLTETRTDNSGNVVETQYILGKDGVNIEGLTQTYTDEEGKAYSVTYDKNGDMTEFKITDNNGTDITKPEMLKRKKAIKTPSRGVGDGKQNSAFDANKYKLQNGTYDIEKIISDGYGAAFVGQDAKNAYQDLLSAIQEGNLDSWINSVSGQGAQYGYNGVYGHNNRTPNQSGNFSNQLHNAAYDGYNSAWTNGWKDYMSGEKSYSEAFYTGRGGGGTDAEIVPTENGDVNNLRLLDSIKRYM